MWPVQLSKWIDRQLRVGRGELGMYMLMVFCGFPFLVALALNSIVGFQGEPGASAILLVCGGLASLGLALWVCWRGWLKFQRFAERRDEEYDRSTKFILPPEYGNTKSATAARRREELR